MRWLYYLSFVILLFVLLLTAQQCGAPEFCGNGFCDYPDETYLDCPKDCPVCGDRVCDTPKETPETCPQDCLVPVCGDGVCDYYTETPETCPVDCAGSCGDGLCTGTETSETCPVDCQSTGYKCSECGRNDCDIKCYCNNPELTTNPSDFGICDRFPEYSSYCATHGSTGQCDGTFIQP